MTEYEHLCAGNLFQFDDEIRSIGLRARRLLEQFNTLPTTEFDKKFQILSELFGSIGEGTHIQGPFYCDFGIRIFIGSHTHINFGATFLDAGKITIGNNVQIGPNAGLYTPVHPIDPEVRKTELELGRPIVIHDNVWLGGHVVVNPGVTIGENSVIGSGSVVTKDIPANVVAVGNPCRVMRQIGEEDKAYWEKMLKNRTLS